MLQLVLGTLWLLDAALQFQPYMFSKGFVTTALASTAQGNPTIIAQPIVWASHLMVHHIVIYNALFATTQLAIAIGLLCRPTVKLALAASIAWSISLWWLGEGLGGVLTGKANPFTGAPGAVILYALIALLVWPRRDDVQNDRPVAASGALPVTAAKTLWLAIWASFVYFTLLPANRSAQALATIISSSSDGEPGWIKDLNSTMASAVAGHGTEVSVVAAVLFAFIGLTVFSPRVARVGILLAVVVGAIIWAVEDFGGIFTGQGTDPNTGPLLMLLAAAFWPVSRHPLGRRTEAAPADLATSAPNRQTRSYFLQRQWTTRQRTPRPWWLQWDGVPGSQPHGPSHTPKAIEPSDSPDPSGLER